jgi:hypothetical protein
MPRAPHPGVPADRPVPRPASRIAEGARTPDEPATRG